MVASPNTLSHPIQAAPGPRPDPTNNRLLVVQGAQIRHQRVSDLPSLLGEGDLLVLNDAATLPASLPGDGVEWRLASRVGPDLWWAVVMGAGDWRTDTDLRPDPGPIPARPRIEFQFQTIPRCDWERSMPFSVQLPRRAA